MSEEPGRLRRDPALASDKFINPLHRHTDVVCKCNLCDAERSEKLLVQYLAGMCGDSVGGNHRFEVRWESNPARHVTGQTVRFMPSLCGMLDSR